MLKPPTSKQLRNSSPRSSVQEPSYLTPSPEIQWYTSHVSNQRNNTFNLSSYERMVESIPYKLSVSRVSTLRVQRKDKKSEQYIRISARFVSNSRKCDLSQSTAILVKIKADEKGTVNVQSPGVGYYHSRIHKNDKDFALLLEFAYVEKSRVNHTTTALGYSVIEPFGDVRDATGIVRKGNWMSSQQNLSGIEFKYSINFNVELKNIVRLVPENMIVGCTVNIPCLVGETLPGGLEKTEIALTRSVTLKVKNLQISLSTKFEAELATFVQKVKENFCRQDRSSKVNIKKRLLRLGFHNGLTMVTSQVRQVESQKESRKNKTVLRLSDRLQQQSQGLDVQIWRDTNGVFVCSVVYQMELEGKGYKQVMEFEASIFVKVFEPNERQGHVQEWMISGPGQGISGRIMKITGEPPTISFQYSIQQRDYRKPNFSPNSGKSFGVSQQRNQEHFRDTREFQRPDSQFLRVEQQKIMLEENLQLLRSMHEIKESQKAMLSSQLQQERHLYVQTQQRMQSEFQSHMTHLNKEQLGMEYEIREMQEKLKIMEMQRDNQRKVRDDQSRAAMVQKQKQAQMQRNNYNKPGNRVFFKDKREAQISSMLYDALEKKFITPAVKASNTVDASEYEQYKVASKFAINFLSIRWDKPRMIYIVVRFFNIAGFKTSNIRQSTLDSGEGKLVRESLTISANESEAVYQFVVDPSLSSNPESLQIDLSNYLFNKSLILDVFDSQTHFYLGQLHFHLKDVLRGKKERVISVKEHLLVSDGKPVCSLHVMISNQSAQCKRQGVVTRNRVVERTNRVVSTCPLIIPDQSKNRILQGAIRETITKGDRRQERINLVKQRNLLESSNNASLNSKDKQQLLQQIQEYKKQTKPEFIKQAYQDFMNDHKEISCYFGRAEVFAYNFSNTESRAAEFRIKVQDPDESLFTIPQLALINKPLEWRHFCQAKNLTFPKNFQAISDTNSFRLQPNESIELLFKFVTFRRMSGYGEQAQSKQRIVNTLVMNTYDNSICSGFSLKVEPHEQVIDRSLIMYENADQPIELVVPLLTNSPKSPVVKPYLVSTYVQSTVSWLSEYQISIKVQALPVMNRLIFNVLLYENQYMDQIRENWRVQLNFYEGISVVCKQSAPVKFRLAIPQAFCNKKIQLYTSSNEVSFLTDLTDGIFTSSNSITVVSGQAVNPSNQRKSVTIHLVDPESSSLHYGWKLNILPWDFRKPFS